MKNKNIFSFILFFICFVLFLLNKSRCEDYRNSYLRDINFIRETLIENHPAPYIDEYRESFLKKLFKNCCIALEKKHSIESYYDYKLHIINFVKLFEDGHIGIQFKEDNKHQNEPILYCQNMYCKIDGNELFIKIPSFCIQYDLEESKNRFKNFLEYLLTVDLSKITKIIFDLQGNGGGSSTVASEILENLFGKRCIDLCNYKIWHNLLCYKRISIKNLEKIKIQYEGIKKYYSENDYMISFLSNQYQEYLNGYNKKQNIIKEDYDYMYQKEGFQNLDIDHEILKNFEPFNHIVIECLIDKYCGSATLDFLDLLKTFPISVELKGEPTFYDSIFMEALSDELPSGNGIFFWPTKVYKNRLRKNNQRYFPGILQEQ